MRKLKTLTKRTFLNCEKSMSKEKRNRKRNKWLTEKRKKWLTQRAFRNCMLVSIGILIISVFFDLAREVYFTELPFPERLLSIWFALILMAVGLWILGFLFPDSMETIFNMLGFKEKEEKQGNDQNS